MATQRFDALSVVSKRKPLKVNIPSYKISDFFGEKVFTLDKMKKYLSAKTYDSVLTAIDKGKAIDRKIADDVAAVMKSWAIEHGATHYTHWFHPLNGATAEKHDSFLNLQKNGEVIEIFEGKQLAQQEPDASSFPSGGLRNTFEARGYTAWDPGSPAFIKDCTLCIPTIFISYTGVALDYKLPLLKALSRIDKAAVSICKYFDKNVKKVAATLGWEQEYFLIDEALYNVRPDIILTGRTLMGHSSAKGQQLEDHYFGAIPKRVSAFMKELEVEAHKLGIPITTRHNEVAPNQFEFAPMFEEANLAIDHNQLFMSLIKDVARKHNFVALLHEKPYEGINGSGKHNNWSLMTDTGINLLAPSKNPKGNLQFLIFLVNTIKAVHDYADLLLASIVSSSNEHRLGANEAPPAIISVFLGHQITEMLNKIEKQVSDRKMTPEEKTSLKLGVGKIPQILIDNTDRNRTSPFAFTGNRFEYRAVGSIANCSAPIAVLNIAVAKQLRSYKKDVDTLIDKGIKTDEALYKVLRKYIIASKKIRFEGDNYSNEWVKEAAKRGLPNYPDPVDALKAYMSKKSIELLEEMDIVSENEMKARLDIKYEMYAKKIQIESRVLGDLAINHIIPTAIKYQNTLIDNVKGLKEILTEEEYNNASEVHLKTITKIAVHMKEIREGVMNMINERKKANKLENIKQLANTYSKKVKPFLENIRYHIDKLELTVDDEIWPLPKYRELLFSR